MKKIGLIGILMALLFLTACANRNDSNAENASTSERTEQTSQSSSNATQAILVTIDGEDYPATLTDSKATRSLLKQLPLELSFRDFSSGFDEKIADLDQALDYNEDENEHDPQASDIGYWSPDQRLVFYYGDVGAYSGIHVMGKFDDESVLAVLENLTEDSQVSIRLAE